MTEYESNGSESSESIVCPWDGCDRKFDSNHGVKVHHGWAHDTSIAETRSLPGDHDCPWEGCKETFQKESAMKVHHTKIHGVSLSADPRPNDHKCPWDGCEEKFTTDRGMKIHHGRVHSVSISESRSFPGNHDCPWDGCDDSFQSEKAMKGHHAHIHGESIAGVEVECAYCDTPKTVKAGVAESEDHHFCSKQHKGEWMSKHQTEGDNPQWGGGGVIVECEVCGKEKEVNRAKAEGQPRHFCSREHSAQWKSENLVGERHPRWKGGVFTYGEGWTPEKKEYVRDRQNRECAGCGRHEKEFGRKHTVHHIQKARSFDDPEKRNDPSNLVALCRKCHRVWEQMSPLRPQTMV